MTFPLERRGPGDDAAGVITAVGRRLATGRRAEGYHDPLSDPALMLWAARDAASGERLSPQRMLAAWGAAGSAVILLRQVGAGQLGDELLEVLPRDDDALSLALACRDAGAMHRLHADAAVTAGVANERLSAFYDDAVTAGVSDIDEWLEGRGGVSRSLGPAALDLVRRRLLAASGRLADTTARVSLHSTAPMGAGVALCARWAPERLGTSGGERWAFVVPARVVGVDGGCDGGAWQPDDDEELVSVALRLWDGEAGSAEHAVSLAREVLAHDGRA